MRLKYKKVRGMSLLEVMVSMGVFSLMIVAVGSIFSSSVASSRSNKSIERSLENAQFVMNKMAKELRTSTVVDPANVSFSAPSTRPNIRFYDYSQGLCIRYHLIAGADSGSRNYIVRTSALADDPATCTSSLLSGGSATVETITTGSVTPTFYVVTSFNGDAEGAGPIDSKLARVGIVSMLFEVKDKKSDARSVILQTSVSLRDYTTSGILH